MIDDVIARYQGRDWKGTARGWKHAVVRQEWHVLQFRLRRLMSHPTAPIFRDQSVIEREYDRQWRKKAFLRYRPKLAPGQGAPWRWRADRFFLSNEAGAAVRLAYLDEALSGIDGESVLEVGCGNGINLHLLSCRHPRRRFMGLELTRSGVEMAQTVIAQGCLSDDLVAFAPFPLVDRAAVSTVSVARGSGASLPFSDGSFDIVVTSLALEQMEQIREAALKEMARVARRHVIMLEPFREVNETGLPRRYVRAYDYFQGAIADLPAYGLVPRKVIYDMPHKATLGTALVIADKREAV